MSCFKYPLLSISGPETYNGCTEMETNVTDICKGKAKPVFEKSFGEKACQETIDQTACKSVNNPYLLAIFHVRWLQQALSLSLYIYEKYEIKHCEKIRIKIKLTITSSAYFTGENTVRVTLI